MRRLRRGLAELFGFVRGLSRLGPRATGAPTSSRPGAPDLCSPATVASAFPREAFEALLDRLVSVTLEAGAAEERRRIAALIDHPKAAGLTRFAWRLASVDGVTHAAAIELLEIAAIDHAVAAAAQSGAPITLH